MKLRNLKTNHFSTPLGMHLQKPIFSWVAEETESKRQAAAEITVSTKGKTVFQSGKREDISSLGFEADFPLSPRTRYDWTVTVWGDGGDSATASSWFETAKEWEPWVAEWITSSFDKEVHPLLSKDFTLDQKPESARAYACGLGLYELYVNGEKAGDEYLLPGFHCYDEILEYQTFDIADLLRPGENVIAAALAPGWYKSRMTWDSLYNVYGDTMKFICEVHIGDGEGHRLIPTDDSWVCRRSPIVESSIYDGEHYDARQNIPGWAKPGCLAESFPVRVLDKKDKLLLHARLSPCILKKQSFKPTLLHTKKDEWVLDFGQVMTGWVEFDVDLPEGRQVLLSYGEVMQDDCFYRDNLRSAKCVYRYDSDGKPAHLRPHFTFYGFRYVKVEGLETVDPEKFIGWHIRSDVDPIGSIETDNPMVNQLFSNAMWGQFDNFLDLPTDCPQRDERLGWTGDAALISATACKNNYVPAFFHHFINNVSLEQKNHSGSVPMYVPSLISAGWTWSSGSEMTGCAIWSDVATLMPWAVYENFGDINLLRREYSVMRDWVEVMRRDDALDGNRGLWLRGTQLGDWLAQDTDDPQSPFGATSLPYTASAFYHYSSLLTGKAATALGYVEDGEKYLSLAEKVRRAMIEEYFEADGSFKIEGTQTACVLSLFLGIYPEGGKKAVLRQLKERIASKNNHLDTGFCGTPYLCRALSENGANDLAYTLFLNEDFPSWLFEVKLGATTVWERWNSLLPDGTISGTDMNSMNHYAYGAIVDWMYRNLCGLNPCEEAPGYKKVRIQPMPDSRIGTAKLRMDSASGEYRVEWHYEGDCVKYAIEIPFDCTADFILPDGTKHTLTAGSYHF